MKHFILIAALLLAAPALAQDAKFVRCGNGVASDGSQALQCIDSRGSTHVMVPEDKQLAAQAGHVDEYKAYQIALADQRKAEDAAVKAKKDSDAAFKRLIEEAASGFVLFVLAMIAIFGSFYTVEQQSVAIVERLGKFMRVGHAGLNFKWPLIERVAHHVSLRLEQLVIKAETKTKDNVFVTLEVATQYQVEPGKEADSYYKLEDEQAQIKSYVLDVVRAQVPKMDLDETFVKKEDIGNAVKVELEESMSAYGFVIRGALITDIDPAAGVKTAMNEIQTQTRMRAAAEQQGEAKKIITIKAAEAEAESKKLQGEGIANQRKAIAAGLKEAAADLAAAGGGDGAEVMHTLLLTQYFDTMKEIGVSAGAKVIFIPNGPGGMNDILGQIRNTVMSAEEAKT